MRRHRTRSKLAAVVVGAAVMLVAATALAASVTGERPDCVDVTADARFAVTGYNHVVGVNNRCDARVRCRISTNVAPTVIELALASGTSREVVTYRDSPAREFTANVDCER